MLSSSSQRSDLGAAFSDSNSEKTFAISDFELEIVLICDFENRSMNIIAIAMPSVKRHIGSSRRLELRVQWFDLDKSGVHMGQCYAKTKTDG